MPREEVRAEFLSKRNIRRAVSSGDPSSGGTIKLQILYFFFPRTPTSVCIAASSTPTTGLPLAGGAAEWDPGEEQRRSRLHSHPASPSPSRGPARLARASPSAVRVLGAAGLR